MPSISDPHARVQEWKRKSPLRVTRARVSVADVLLQQSQPLSAELVFRELLDKGEEVSLGSVYRILKQMEDEGLVQRAPAELWRLQGRVFDLQRVRP